MKRVKSLSLAVLCAWMFTFGCFASADLFSIKTLVPASPSRKECAIPVQSGTVYEFSAADLERRIGLAGGSLQGVTVTSLPTAAQGTLVLEGVELDPYQFLTREELDELCFVPAETAAAAAVTLQPQGADSKPVHLSITVLDILNAPPVVENGSFYTLENTRISGAVTAVDPDGDTVKIQVVNPPRKGEVTFDGLRFQYTPFLNESGSDFFTFCAVDRFGNYSDEATVEIRLEPARSGFRYVDMAGNPSEYAAFKLHEAEVLSGEQVGGGWFFRPERQVTRGEFLVMVLAAAGLDGTLSPTVNTGLPEDAELPLWIKPYLKKAVGEGVWSASRAFRPDEVPTRAEAVQMVDFASGITDVKDFSLRANDLTDIPTWALSSYKDLAAYRMLDLHDGYAHPQAALNRAYAADLLWQLYKHTHR